MMSRPIHLKKLRVGDLYSWVVPLTPKETSFDDRLVVYVADLERRRRWNRGGGRASLGDRKRSVQLAKTSGLWDAALAYYRRLGWDEIQLHHMDGIHSGVGTPSRWVFAPRCIHMQLFHGKTCRKSHPLHPQYGRSAKRTRGRRSVSRSYL